MPRKQRKAEKGEGNIVAHAPREFVEFPVFAVGKQNGPREVIVFGKKWTIGGIPDPLDDKKEIVLTKSLDHDHAAVVMCLLQKYHEQNGIDDNYAQAIGTSLGEIAKRIYGYDQAQYRHKIRSLLRDLRYTNISIELSPKKRRIFSIVDGFVFDENDEEKDDLQLEKVRFNIEFAKQMLNYQNMYKIRYDVYLGMTSPLAKAIYMQIPSRIEKCGKDNPLLISLEKMLNDVGVKAPEYKSVREKMFIQGKNSVVSQLDGADTLANGKMSVKIEDGVDDYIILFWVEKPSNNDAIEAEIVGEFGSLDKGAKEKLDKMEMEFRESLWSGGEAAFRRMVLTEWGGIEAVETYVPQMKTIIKSFKGDNKTAFINKLCKENAKRFSELKKAQKEMMERVEKKVEQPNIFEYTETAEWYKNFMILDVTERLREIKTALKKCVVDEFHREWVIKNYSDENSIKSLSLDSYMQWIKPLFETEKVEIKDVSA